MEALARDLRDSAPDLARQFAASRPTVRRNSGFGLFTEMMVDPALSNGGPSGDFGTVHAMIAHLRDPVAFTVRLQDGRLIGLMGDSYGQDTRALDFGAVPFTQIFSVDASGRSVPFESSAAPRGEPATDRAHARPAPRTPASSPPPVATPRGTDSPPPRVRVAPAADLARVLEAAAQSPRAAAKAIQRVQEQVGADPAATPDSAPADKVTLLIGAWAVIAVVAVLAVLVFDASWPFALVIAIWLGAAVRKPKALAAIQRGLDAYHKARAAQRG